VIRGGSHSYLAPLTAPFRERITKDTTIIRSSIRILALRCSSGILPALQFDEVVFACRGDRILPLLAQPTEAEHKILSCFTTTRNETCLHTNSTLLPKRVPARASWNYLLGDSSKGLRAPLYTRAAVRAQDCWPEISGKSRTPFCGAYWYYGLHGGRCAERHARGRGLASPLLMNPQPALYTGTLRHRRFRPRKHDFTYKLFMAWLDIDRIPWPNRRAPATTTVWPPVQEATKQSGASADGGLSEFCRVPSTIL
jgi:hypothetical protein